MKGGNIKISGPVSVPPIIDMTISKFGTNSAIIIAKTDIVVRTIHLFTLKSAKDYKFIIIKLIINIKLLQKNSFFKTAQIK